MLAELAEAIPFVFFSTDIVFDGRKGNYTETDAVNPIHVYGETKAAAEQIVLKNPRHLVVRTSINGGASRAGRAFNEQLRRSLRQPDRMMKLFTDEFRCPIPAVETARAVWDLVKQNRAGLFHIAGAEKLSRWQIGLLLAPRWPEVTAKLEPNSAKNFRGPPRALDTSLDISKAQKILSQPLPRFSEWLAAHPDEAFESVLSRARVTAPQFFHCPLVRDAAGRAAGQAARRPQLAGVSRTGNLTRRTP